MGWSRPAEVSDQLTVTSDQISFWSVITDHRSLLSVSGFARQLAGVDADLAQGAAVFAVDVGAEDQLGIGRAMQPAVFLDFALELTGRPAGVTERQYRALRALAARDRFEDVEGGGEANAVVDRQRGILDVEIRRVQHESASGLDRPALEHLDDAGARRQLNELGGRDDFELDEKFGESDIGRRLVDDDAHRALGRVRADVDQRAGKTLVAHGRHGDEHLAVEITSPGRFGPGLLSATH